MILIDEAIHAIPRKSTQGLPRILKDSFQAICASNGSSTPLYMSLSGSRNQQPPGHGNSHGYVCFPAEIPTPKAWVSHWSSYQYQLLGCFSMLFPFTTKHIKHTCSMLFAPIFHGQVQEPKAGCEALRSASPLRHATHHESVKVSAWRGTWGFLTVIALDSYSQL